MKLTPAVNFINIIHAHFLYESLFKAKTYLEKATKMTFVRKICTFNVDEIDTRKDIKTRKKIERNYEENESKFSFSRC